MFSTDETVGLAEWIIENSQKFVSFVVKEENPPPQYVLSFVTEGKTANPHNKTSHVRARGVDVDKRTDTRTHSYSLL